MPTIVEAVEMRSTADINANPVLVAEGSVANKTIPRAWLLRWEGCDRSNVLVSRGLGDVTLGSC